MKRKLLAILLAGAMILSMAPTGFAADAGTSAGGTLDPVTKVSTYGNYTGFYADSELYPAYEAHSVYVQVPAAYEGVYQNDPNASTKDFIDIALTYVLPADASGKAVSGKYPAVISCYRDVNPGGGRFPNGGSTLDREGYPEYLVERGYAYIAIDLRGNGASFGLDKGFGTEESGRDVTYIIDNWLPQQAWYSGKCAMMGASNRGLITGVTAVHDPKTLAGYMASVSSLDYYGQKYPNGVSIANNASNLLPKWSVDTFPDFEPDAIQPYEEWKEKPTAQFVDDDPEGVKAYQAYVHQRTNSAIQHFFKYEIVPNLYRDSATDANWSDGWEIFMETNIIDNVQELLDAGVEIYGVAGYADSNCTAQLALVNVAGGRILMSDGTHVGAQTGGTEAGKTFDSKQDVLRFFDWLLKGKDSGFEDAPYCYYYLLNNHDGSPWHYADSMPYDATEYRSYYFGDSSEADLAAAVKVSGADAALGNVNNNGTLVTTASAAGKSVDYTVDTSVALNITGQSAIGKDDLHESFDGKGLTFTTEPMAADTLYTGVASLDVWASCANAEDFDLFANIEVVKPDGSSHYLSRGMMRASHRVLDESNIMWNGTGIKVASSMKDVVQKTKAEDLSRPVLLSFSTEIVSVVLDKGDSIRVTLVGYNGGNSYQPYMYYDAQGDLLTGSALPKITVYTGGQYASKLVLPVVPTVDNTYNGVVTMSDGSYHGPATMYLLEENYFLQYDGAWKKLDKTTDDIHYVVSETGEAWFYNAGFKFQPEGAPIANGLAQVYTQSTGANYPFPATFDGYQGVYDARAVTTAKSGTYIGTVVKSDSALDPAVMGTDIIDYRGVKFADFGLFQAPKLVGASDNVYLAQTVAPNSGNLVSGSGDKAVLVEDYFDCLGCEIYVNPTSTKTNKAVFMWNYGSGQMGGQTSRIDARNFVAKNPDVIVVLSTHRGSVFGSVDVSVLDGYDASAAQKYWGSNNLARLDLLACLKWINENIAYFGGDPNNVTIGGQSSGSNNVTCLLLMEEAWPYFQKAIMESSFSVDISLQPQGPGTAVEDYANAYFKAAGVSSVAQLEALMATPEGLLTLGKAKSEVNKNLTIKENEYKGYTPVVDDQVIPSNYYEKLLNGGLAGKKLVFGSNEGEYDNDNGYVTKDGQTITGLKTAEEGWAYTISQNWGKLSDHGWNAANSQAVLDEFRSHDAEYGRDDLTSARDMKNDLFLRLGAMTYAEAASLYTDVYFYYNEFDIAPEGTDINDFCRARHSSEIPVLFRDWTWSEGRSNDTKNLNAFLDMADPKEKDVAMTLSDIWASFILTGDPNCASLAAYGVKWTPYDRYTHDTMVFGKDNETFQMVDGVRQKDADLLLPLFREYPLLTAKWAELDAGGSISVPSTPATPTAPATPVAPAISGQVKVGDTVTFTGDTHYYSANSTSGKAARPGTATVTGIYPTGKHPYQLIGKTVYGWVDAADIAGAAAPSSPAPSGAIVRGAKVTVNAGAKTYAGGSLAKFVYSTVYTVIEVEGERVVIGLDGVATAAVNIKDLTPADH